MDLGKSPNDSTLAQSITVSGVSVIERLHWANRRQFVFVCVNLVRSQRGGNETGSL